MPTTRKRRPHETNTGIKVTGWSRCLVLKDLFDRQFNPKDGIYHENDPHISMGFEGYADDRWGIIITFEFSRPANRDWEERFRVFINGAVSAIYHYDPPEA